jgi:myo-inositol-hexaphosphate 3-phosphohydrolase
LGLALVLVSLALPGPRPAHAQAVISAVRPLAATGFQDEDDMCIWLHPTNLALSTIVVSDKAAGKLFVYDLQGATLQTIASSQPGNIDVRYNFRFGGQLVDIVAFNERGTSKICVYEVDRVTRLLTRIDDDAIATGNNYGFTLYRSPLTGKVYGFTGPESNTAVKQWELVDDGAGHVAGVDRCARFSRAASSRAWSRTTRPACSSCPRRRAASGSTAPSPPAAPRA